ncbi:MAG: rane fusion protein heavy metal efflux system [Alphaproteobacteria bacterium]|jgi:cobalt-zinc-cadmium efflux system membrane fusion protein|nr:rane fusion protein heavy metal efflux system [Alphaproteobacteria bacterium]
MSLSQYARAMLRHTQAMIVVAALAVAAVVIVLMTQDGRGTKVTRPTDTEVSSQAKRSPRFVPTPAQWASLGMEPVKAMTFRSEHVTEGKISINEDKATPIFPPYAGRVTRLMAKPGDTVERGQPLFYIEAADMVQAQNDFLTALAAINRAKSRVTITEIIEKQNRTLYEGRAGSLRDFQTATADLAQARADLRTAESSLEAARNRLAILGKTDAEITAFQEHGRISSETPIYAPLSGTVVQRKIGPGQYVSYTSTGAVDPVFTIGDLSTVWLVAYVRESEAPKVRAGQQLDFTVLAYPRTTFKANIDHVAASLDPNIRRLMVRATIDNSHGQFKPEMFTSVTIYTDEGDSSLGVPRAAVIYEAENARVWVARSDKTIEVRQIKTGITRGNVVQVLQGLQPSEMVVTKGSLFVDQAAGS